MSSFAVTRYLPDGQLDPQFSSDGILVIEFITGSSTAFAVAVDSVDRVLAAGSVQTTGGGSEMAVVRLTQIGRLDGSFSQNGKALIPFPEGPSVARAVAVDHEGRVVVAGSVRVAAGTQFAVARLGTRGNLDASFGTGGRVTTPFAEGQGFALGVSIDPQNRIVVAGFINTGSPGNSFALIRYNVDGSLDTGFNTDGKMILHFQGRDTAFSVKHDARQRIVVAGVSSAAGGTDSAIARLRVDGTLDPTFGVNGRVYTDLGGSRAEVFGVALDKRSHIVVAGLARGDLDMFGVARFLTNGEYDQNFGNEGRAQAGFFDTDGAQGVAIDSTDRIVTAGYTGTLSEGTIFALARFLPTGVLDASFGAQGEVFTNLSTGVDDRAQAVSVDSVGRIVAAGSSAHAPDWPLSRGPFGVGVLNIELLVREMDRSFKTVIYYPATRDGNNAPIAPTGGPFPLIAYAHANRDPAFEQCPGSPTDFTNDHLQLSAIHRHLARRGYVTIASDQSSQIAVPLKQQILEAGMRHLIQENARSGSTFKGRLRTSGVTFMGHSTGGGSAIEAALTSDFDVAAVATLAPGINGLGSVSQINAPLLVVFGTRDNSAVSGNPGPIYNAGVAPKHRVLIEGANHFGFTDELCVTVDANATIPRGDQRRIATAYITAFLQRYVNNVATNASYLDGSRQIETLESFGIEVEAVL